MQCKSVWAVYAPCFHTRDLCYTSNLVGLRKIGRTESTLLRGVVGVCRRIKCVVRSVLSK